MYNFSSSRRLQEGNCANCQQQRANGILAKALVPITDSLLRQAQSPNFTDIGSLERDVVKDYLANHLEWRIVVGVSQDTEVLFFVGSIRSFAHLYLVQGRLINATKEDVHGLKVFAMNGTAEYYEDESKLGEILRLRSHSAGYAR